MSDEQSAHRPTLRVISGDATPEEIAAVLAVVAARSSVVAAERGPRPDVSTWASRRYGHRGGHARPDAGQHAWRTSFWLC